MTIRPRLFDRPIAHRGLHDLAQGAPENSLAAARAAVMAGYAIECDVQLSSDGEAIVFHDDTLERLTRSEGPVGARRFAELTQMRLADTQETIPSLASLLDEIDGRALLVIEIKSRFDGAVALAERVAQLVDKRGDSVVIESFDPVPIAFLRRNPALFGGAEIPLGMVGMAKYDAQDWPGLTQEQRAELTNFLHYERTRPDFLSWNREDLPHAIPLIARAGLGAPVTTWTVRSQEEARAAAPWADQIVFEGFRP